MNVTITCATAGATIRYTSGSGTTPGADPTTASSVVPANGIVNVPVPGWLKAKAWKDGMIASAAKETTFAVEEQIITFNPDGGAHSGSSVIVTINATVGGVMIRYTVDGSEPNESSAAVDFISASGGTVTVPIPGTLRAKALMWGVTEIGQKSAQYTNGVQLATPVHRFWSDQFGAHFYIMGNSERDRIAAKYPGIWRYETVAWYAYPTQAAGTQPVHRFWSDQLGKHFYIMGDSERDRIAAKYQGIWRYETVAWYAYPTQVVGTQPVGRFWSDQFMGHFYTITQAEINRIAAKYPGIWNYETVAYWAFLTPPAGMQAVAASVPSTSGLDALSSTNPGETLTPEEGEATVGTDETANGVVFPLAVAGARVSAFVYDATADKPTQILDGADSPGEAVFSGVEPDRDYRFEVWQDGAGSKKAVLVHASSFERRLDPPATLADAADASDGGDGVVGAPAARILTPAAEGTLTLKLYSAAAGVVETRGDVAGGETVDFSLPVWNRWYWVGGWRDADGELVLSLWLRHELETGN